MNNSNTPKIVVGVGLVAVYAVGLTVLTLRGKHEVIPATPAAVSAPADAMAPTVDPSVAEASVPSLAEAPSPPLSETPAAVAQAPAVKEAVPAPVAPAPRTRTEVPAQAEVAATTAPSPANDETASAGNVTRDSATEPAPMAASNAPAATPVKDSQITADVKSKVEAVAPGVAIDVTTKDGVVELAGSVPSQDALEKARLAASNVRDVRGVDVSALTISN
jgi:hypothetical protein